MSTRCSASRWRPGDSAFLISSSFEGKRPRGILTYPPLVAIEILSPEDRHSRLQARMDDFLNFAVPQVWLIDPLTRRAWVYTRAECREALDRILRIDDPPVAIPLDEIFASIDRNIQQ